MLGALGAVELPTLHRFDRLLHRIVLIQIVQGQSRKRFLLIVEGGIGLFQRRTLPTTGGYAILAFVGIGSFFPLIETKVDSFFHFPATDAPSDSLFGIAVSLSTVNAGIVKEGSQLVEVLVGIATPQLIGPRVGMVEIRHDGTRGVVNVDENGRHVKGRGYFLEKESRRDGFPPLLVPHGLGQGNDFVGRRRRTLRGRLWLVFHDLYCLNVVVTGPAAAWMVWYGQVPCLGCVVA